MTNITFQQQYVALAFVYGDNRQYVDLLDPSIFGNFGPVISVIKEHRIMADIWSNCLTAGCDMESIIECDLDVAMYYRTNAGKELLRLWEMAIEQKYRSGTKKLGRDEVKKLNELYTQLKERLENQKENNVIEEAKQYIAIAKEKSGVKTGLDYIDKHVGWLRSGTITRLSGYSNVGKSRFMYRVIANILRQGKTAHVFSLEVPKGMVLINLVGAYYNVNTASVENGHQEQNMTEFYEKYKDKLLIEDDKMSLEQIESSIVQNNKDVIFIDYVQNIRAQGKEEYERMTKIAQELQKMAITTKKPFFDLSQVSNEGSRYKVGDMIPSKGSGAFVHACEIGLVLYKGDEGSNQLKLAIAKNKFGAKDIEIILHVDMGKCEFTFFQDNTFSYVSQ